MQSNPISDPKTAVVIGAGIAGPTAALSLATLGFSVTVYEQRAESELRSDGLLGITDANWQAVRDMGADISRHEITFTEDYDQHGISWTNLHKSLVEAGYMAGVEFHFGTKAPSDIKADIIVRATGVGTAKEVSKATPTGYSIARGTSRQFAGTSWEFYRGENGNGQPLLFTVGDSENGASWTLFYPSNVRGMQRTSYSVNPPTEVGQFDARLRDFAYDTALVQTTPLSDWTVPEYIVTRNRRETFEVRIGDANGQLRPATSQGANQGMREALQVAALSGNSKDAWELEYFLRMQREYWTMVGQEIDLIGQKGS